MTRGRKCVHIPGPMERENLGKVKNTKAKKGEKIKIKRMSTKEITTGEKRITCVGTGGKK